MRLILGILRTLLALLFFVLLIVNFLRFFLHICLYSLFFPPCWRSVNVWYAKCHLITPPFAFARQRDRACIVLLRVALRDRIFRPACPANDRFPIFS